MKVIHLSSSDTNGGAAIAAKRICEAQQNISGLNSKLFVGSSHTSKEYIFSTQLSFFDNISNSFNRFADELSNRLLSIKSKGRFTFPFFGTDISQNDQVRNADILNFHWINGGFLSLNSLIKIGGLNKPIVWTLHDMWAFTGGCHYTSGCEKFTEHCFECPSLLFKSKNDLSFKIFEKKKEIFKNLNLTIITCSKWLATETKSSSLLGNKNIINIPNPVDVDLFQPISKSKSREKLNLPLHKRLILSGAMNLKDQRKGFQYLIEALDLICKSTNKHNVNIELVVFGKLDDNVANKIPVKVYQLGKLKSEEDIVMAYNSADAFVAPSIQDNLPNTIMESMACGVPVVAFNVGGIPDMIDHKQNGILAELRSSEELADGINLILGDENLHKRYSTAAREKVINNFNPKIVVEKYFELYKSIL